jgi:hypothetical protein
MMSQEDRMLLALKQNPEGLHPTFFIVDLHVYQYNRAVNTLRTRFGCSHKNGNTVCLATEHIINKDMGNGTTLFFYRKTEGVDWEKERLETIKKQNTVSEEISQQNALF